MTEELFQLPHLPARDAHSHKGTFGTVAVVGGCCRSPVMMPGAPAIAAHAALRAGCGLVRLVMPAPILATGLQVVPSATGRAFATGDDGEIIGHEAAAVIDELCDTCDALVVGPGMGTGDGPRAVSLRAAGQQHRPVVIDADALNCLAEIPQFYQDFKAHAVLTPHPGEYRRLAKSLNLSSDPIDPASRPAACAELAQRLGAIIVLKGAHTVVSDGLRTWICSHADATLATAGTGDTLAGLIGSLLAQYVSPPREPDLKTLAMQRLTEKSPALAAKVREQTHVTSDPLKQTERDSATLDLYAIACIGVEAHARAAAAWRANHHANSGLLAMELGDELPAVLTSMRAAR